MAPVRMTLLGGPTLLIEAAGIRALTDPTFDGPGSYPLPHATLVKTAGPALGPDRIGRVDVVLLSHDQHVDNLDRAGRAFVESGVRVLTTRAAASRLKGRIDGLAPWETVEVAAGAAPPVRVTATPARHGPAGIEPLSGDVIGFLLASADGATRPIYVTGDTVWYDGVAEVARRYSPGIVVLFTGAARTRGPFHLTMDTNDAIETAHACPDAVIVPIHYDGWAHFSQGRQDLEQSFTALGIGARLHLLQPGVATTVAA